MRLLVIFGPPAVGKMTVGRAVADRSDFRLFHNHAVLEPLLARNRTEHRLAEKRPKRDVDWSDDNVRELEAPVMNTAGDAGVTATPGERFLAAQRHRRIDNTDLSPAEAADRILAWLDGG